MAIKYEININTILVNDFSTQLSQRERPALQKINKEITELNQTFKSKDLIIYIVCIYPIHLRDIIYIDLDI